MKTIVITLLALMLSGCAAIEKSQQEAIAKVNQQDDATCLSYGFVKGTDGYANCRMQLTQIHESRKATNTGALLGLSNYYSQQAAPRRYPSSTTMTNCWNTVSGVSCMTQ